MLSHEAPAFKIFRLEIPEIGGGYTLVLGRFGIIQSTYNEIQRYSKSYFLADCIKGRYVTFNLPLHKNRDIKELIYYRFNEAGIGGGYIDSYIIASFINSLQSNIDKFIDEPTQWYQFDFTPEQQDEFNNSHPRI
jgi:hypothetical protein